MIAATVSEQYRCLLEILTCPVCKDLVAQAHICPNCSKFYCFDCINRQLGIEQKCLNCNRFLSAQMLTNCQKLCSDLSETLQKVKLRGLQSTRASQNKSHNFCYSHKLEKTYYCQTCDKSLCSDCSVLTDSHRGHEFIKLSIMKSNFKRTISQKQQEISTFISRLEDRARKLKEGCDQQEIVENKSLLKLRDQLKKQLKKILREGEKKLNLYNDALEDWNNCYQQEIATLKSTSQGKFVQEQYQRLQAKLLKIMEEAVFVENDLQQTCTAIKLKNIKTNYINPDYYNYVFLIDSFRQKSREVQFFYTETVTTHQGLQIRLKIYPRGVPEEEEPERREDLKMSKRHSKNDEYLAIFIELVGGPVSSTKLKHQIILNNTSQEQKEFVRQFESEFDVGLCWGYDHFIKLSQLFDEGYYNKELDFIEVGLKIGPCNYYQATKDQLGLIQAKQQLLRKKKEQTNLLQRLLSQKEMVSTLSLIDEEDHQ